MCQENPSELPRPEETDCSEARPVWPETPAESPCAEESCVPAAPETEHPAVPPRMPGITELRPHGRQRQRAALCLCALILAASVLLCCLPSGEKAAETSAAPETEDGEVLPDSIHDYFAAVYNTTLLMSGPGIRDSSALGSGLKIELEDIPADSEPLSYQEVYARVNPAVVGVDACLTNGVSWGTGVLISPDGYIVTNTHIIAGAYSLLITLADGREYAGFVVGSDTDSDLTVLKIYGQEDFPCADFGDSELLRVGDEVLAIGNPLGADLRGTMTNGIVSAISRDVNHGGTTMTLIQTNAALNEGNSGGVLVNLYGQVVGITNMKIANSAASSINVEGIGFAIPATTVKTVADQLLATGYIPGGTSIGITVYKVTEELAEYYQVPQGIYVITVRDDADAAARGLTPGDIITQVEGQNVYSAEDVAQVKSGMAVGDKITLTVWRDGETLTMEVALAEAGIQ